MSDTRCKCSVAISMIGDGCRYCQPQEHIDRISEWLDEEREEVTRLQTDNEALQAECEKLRKDATRLDWLENQAKKSPTGISFDYHKYVEDGYVLEHGFRFMRRHFASGFKDNIRKAIDAAMQEDQP